MRAVAEARRGRRWLAGGLVALSLIVLPVRGGAQSTSPTPPAAQVPAGDVQVLRERVAAFWAARVAEDPTRQWELLEPRGRGRMTPGEYVAGRGAVKYVAYEVEDATVDGYFAIVKVRLLFQPILPVTRRVPVKAVVIEDRWVRIRGVWYRRLDEVENSG